MNFGSALVALLGGVTVLLFGSGMENLHLIISAIAAGGFIYIAGSDLIPELHKECAPRASIIQILTFLLGIALMYAFTFLGV
jgi:zinc and cadmium transporter